ncbi:hypothetical protein V8G54_012345 [Vigna mungo]|uniref:F-box associated domain-containing protein n=1 Tax=Vigna mungo TaxID=3915 RepID=A0AAQ3S3X9_VIGMU
MTHSEDYGIDGKFYFDGMCHWLSRIHGDLSGKPCLVSFDMSNETYYTTPTPLDIPLDICDNFYIDCVRWYVFILNRSIALMSTYEYNNTFYISILIELGMKETWNKLFTLGSSTCITRSIGGRNMDNILFQTHDGALVWYDLSTQKNYKG